MGLPRVTAPAYDALLFDFDGVLADTELVHYACWRDVLLPFRLEIDWPWYQANCVGIADHVLAPCFGVGDPDALVADKQQRFRAALALSPPFLPETLALIGELAAHYKMAVVSSSFRTEIAPPLERAGLDRYFATILCGDDVRRLKPAPDPYLQAAEILRAQRPLVIEDSDTGVASGEAAGFDVLRVPGPAHMPRQLRAHLAGGN
jgi:HAD superfamily hydrolase (TIGR01509 family)